MTEPSTTPRTQDEIADRMRGLGSDDPLGFRAEVLAAFLDYEHAHEFLKPEVTAVEWNDVLDPADAGGHGAKYAEFAWGKIRDHRGISASRSVEKLREYAWVAGRDDALEAMDAADYPQYGAPQVAAVCEAMGWPVPAGEDLDRMRAGLPCAPGCAEGCGS